jgi:imidazoleglycerol phosphate synthase glutamine amidotransferase subunit HisH
MAYQRARIRLSEVRHSALTKTGALNGQLIRPGDGPAPQDRDSQSKGKLYRRVSEPALILDTRVVLGVCSGMQVSVHKPAASEASGDAIATLPATRAWGSA